MRATVPEVNMVAMTPLFGIAPAAECHRNRNTLSVQLNPAAVTWPRNVDDPMVGSADEHANVVSAARAWPLEEVNVIADPDDTAGASWVAPAMSSHGQYAAGADAPENPRMARFIDDATGFDAA